MRIEKIYLLRSRKLISFKVLHGSIRYLIFWKKYGKAKSLDVYQHPMPTPNFTDIYVSDSV